MTVIIDSTAEIDAVRLREQGGDPAAPSASHWLVYAKAAGVFVEDSGATVVGPLGAGGGGATIGTGSEAALPSPGTSGNVYLPNNGVQLYRSTGAAQVPWGPLYPFIDPNLQTWAWRNQGGASVDSSKGGIFLQIPAGSGDNYRFREMTLPAAPYKITLGFVCSATRWSNTMGLALIDSGTGKFEILRTGDYDWAVDDFTSVTLHSALVTPSFGGAGQTGQLVWFQVEDDNAGNRIWRMSLDGQHFINITSIASNAFLTPNRIAFGGNEADGVLDCGMLVTHWKIE